MVKLRPMNGFAAETTAALIIQAASYYGIPLSTTHVITTSIMGVGAVKRFSGIEVDCGRANYLGPSSSLCGKRPDWLRARACCDRYILEVAAI
jgi:phosphate/sulfate permease